MTATASPHVLYVDDEHLLHSVVDRLFRRHGIAVTPCTSAREAVEQLRRTRFDLVLTDFRMPDMDGIELLAHVREHYPGTPVILLTAHASVQHAVGAMRDGAVDYIPKPFSTAALLERIEHHLARTSTADTPAEPPRMSAPAASVPKGTFVGHHPSVAQLQALVGRIAQSEAAVFVHGESGTGKEVVSRWLHRESRRAGGPFVAINCASLPTDLVESHLFGHRKGAFTGAIEDMTGAFEQAEGGTLLLDEITEIDLAVQAKLLRVLQEREYQKLGASTPTRANVRIVATSNRNLQGAIDAGVFREDLYHRLAVFPLYVPPLRERAADIALLARHFVDKYVGFYRLPPKALAPDLLARLEAYRWPGNVRQLENTVHRGVVLAGEAPVIALADVLDAFGGHGTPAVSADTAEEPPGTVAPPPPATPTERPIATRGRTIEAVERDMILAALADAGQNQEAAARQLGVSSRTIRNKLRLYREQGHIGGEDGRAAARTV